MELGAFSMSLTVKDLLRSRTFYEKLGFEVTGGEPEENWLILKNGTCIIGLFQGMFDRNILTFNPGLTNDARGPEDRLDTFTDIRAIQRHLQAKGLMLTSAVDEAGNPDGPASLTLVDPDGNPILIDQFFERPAGS